MNGETVLLQDWIVMQIWGLKNSFQKAREGGMGVEGGREVQQGWDTPMADLCQSMVETNTIL